MKLPRLRHPLVLVAILSSAIACVALLASSAAGSPATTYYVSPTGNDRNPGTVGQPWRTPQHAVDVMDPGDTTFVLAGTYAGRTSCDASSGDGGSAGGGYVSLKAYPGTRPVLTGAVAAIFQMSCDYFDLEGFDIAGPAMVNGTDVYPESGSDHVRLARNNIHGSICQGISMDANTSNYEIVGNRIYDNGNRSTACDEQAHGLYIQGNRHLVTNNLVYDNHNYGIHRYPRGANSVIAYNTVVFNGVSTGKSGIASGRESLDETQSGDAIVSNILAFNGAWGIHRTKYAPTSCDIHGNLIYGNPQGTIEGGFPSGCVGRNIIGADPLFGAALTRNLHLLIGSPAIDVGDPNRAPSIDFDGFVRPAGAGPDVGAYEFGSHTAPPAPPPSSPQAPTLQSRPVLRGVARKGHKLATSAGRWSGSGPMKVRFRWRRCNKHGQRCTSIPRATRRTRKLRSRDVGSRLYAVVIATNSFGSRAVRTKLSRTVKR